MSGARDIIAGLVALYPRAQVPPETVMAYAAALEHIPDDLLRAATREMALTSPWLPSVADIAAACARREVDAPPAWIAWEQVGKCLAGTVMLDEVHPLVRRVVRNLGGWYAFRHSESPDRLRRDFLSLYGMAYGEVLRDAQLGED